MRRTRVWIGFTVLLLAGSCAAAWVAVGRLAAATARGLDRTAESLRSGRDLAASTAASADELQRVIGVVGEGLGSTGSALVATRQVSANVRGLLDVVSFFDRVDNLAASLEEAESSIANVEVDLAEAAGSVDEAGPVLAQTIDALQGIPAELDRSIAEVEASRTRVNRQVLLWRLAIVGFGVALVVLVWQVGRLGKVVANAVGPHAGG